MNKNYLILSVIHFAGWIIYLQNIFSLVLPLALFSYFYFFHKAIKEFNFEDLGSFYKNSLAKFLILGIFFVIVYKFFFDSWVFFAVSYIVQLSIYLIMFRLPISR